MIHQFKMKEPVYEGIQYDGTKEKTLEIMKWIHFDEGEVTQEQVDQFNEDMKQYPPDVILNRGWKQLKVKVGDWIFTDNITETKHFYIVRDGAVERFYDKVNINPVQQMMKGFIPVAPHITEEPTDEVNSLITVTKNGEIVESTKTTIDEEE